MNFNSKKKDIKIEDFEKVLGKLEIIFQNESFLIINKKSGIVVNRSETTMGDTLQDLLDAEFDFSKDSDHEFIDRSGIVHRLDKETSGVLIVAKNSTAFRALQAQFKARTVKKEYVALTHGEIVPKSGIIKASVGRLPWNRKRFGVLAGGREAVTNYKVEKVYEFNNEFFSFVRLFPETGRTHQIRVHLKYIYHPIFSDQLYGGRKTARNDRKLLERISLHAEKIKFYDPDTKKELSFTAKLPEELSSLLEKLNTSNIII